jgi:alpha-mannosidase
MKQMYEFKYPVTPAQHGRNEGKLFGTTHSFFKISPESLCLTTLKKAEKGNYTVMRFYNPLDKAVRGKVWSHYTIKKAMLCKIDETGNKPIEVSGSSHEISISVPAKKIITLKISI